MFNLDYLQYYYLENYLFLNVNDNFNKNHRIDAFDFVCILKWQCIEFDIKEIKKNLIDRGNTMKEIPKRFKSNFDFLIKKITREVYSAETKERKAEILFEDWSIPPDIVINTLAVMYSDDFLFFTNIAAKILDGGSGKKFQHINTMKTFKSFWKRYNEYCDKINKITPRDIKGNDKVRWLAGKQIQQEAKFSIH